MKIEKFTYFYPEQPGLIHIDQGLFTSLSMNPAWIAELKKNGKRLALHRLPSSAWQFWNRHGEQMSYRPDDELAAALAEMPLEAGKYYLFDGELCHGKVVGVRHRIMLYDCFIFGNELLTGVPFVERRGVLETLAKNGRNAKSLELAEQFPANFRAVFDQYTTDPEIEGLVIKRLDGKLNLGRNRAANSTWMMKVRKPSKSYKF